MTEELLIRFINNTCTDAELTAVREWLDEREDNAAELFEMEKAAMLAGETRDNAGHRDRLLADIRRRISGEELQQRRRKRALMTRWWSAAAAVVAIAMTMAYMFNQPGARMIRVETFADNRTVTLPDGSTVFLNHNSTLEYPEFFAKTSRDVTLNGEGFFKVAHDKNHPFVVNGRHINVTVLGTVFNFNSRDIATNNVSLIEGSVKVNSKSGREGVVLVPGQKAEYDTHTGNLTVTETNPAIDAAWHDRMIPFENAGFKDIATALEQLYDVKVKLNGIDHSKTYSGVTIYYDNVDSTLSRLSNTLPIVFHHKGDTIVISKK